MFMYLFVFPSHQIPFLIRQFSYLLVGNHRKIVSPQTFEAKMEYV